MEGEKPGQKEDGKGWVSVPSQAAPQEFLGIPFWKQLSIKQPLLGPGYQGPDSHSHLKLNPQLLLCTLSWGGLEGGGGIQDTEESQTKAPCGRTRACGLQDCGQNQAGIWMLRSEEQKMEEAHLGFFPHSPLLTCTGMGPPGMLK